MVGADRRVRIMFKQRRARAQWPLLMELGMAIPRLGR
jgi:hypothetical protein